MITDALLSPLIAAVRSVLELLPVGTAPNLPSLQPVWDLIGGLDSLVPIVGPLLFMLGLLSGVVVFVTVRLVLTLWNLIWP